MKEIFLTQGAVALVDDDLYHELNRHQWYLTFYGYAARDIKVDGKKQVIMMHKVVMGVTDGLVDHKDRNELNNQRSNLRLCTKQQNAYNAGPHFDSASGYKGVSWWQQRQKWKAEIYINGKHKYLGSFIEPEDAAHAYDVAAAEVFGEFAYLNFPDLIGRSGV